MSIVMIVSMKNQEKTVHLAGSATNGTKIQLWDKLPSYHDDFQNQLFNWDGKVFVSVKNPIKCLHLEGGGTGNGTKIQLWDKLQENDPSRSDQEWLLEGKNIVSRKKTSACWHLYGGNTGNRTKIQLWDEKNHENGSWRLEKVDFWLSRSIRWRSLCRIFSMKSPGKVVVLEGGRTSNGTRIQLGDEIPLGAEGYENQLWVFEGGHFRSSKDDSKCLHLDGGRTEDGTKVHLWNFEEKGHPNQRWSIIQGVNIVSEKERDSSACWHLEGGRTANGTKIVIMNEKNHENGAWRKKPLFTFNSKL